MNKVELKFLAKTENVILARSMVNCFLIELDIYQTIINEIKIAVSEAVTNAIIHGYELNEKKEVIMRLTHDDDYIKVVVIDYGKGITDIEKAKEPTFTESPFEFERAGLGFTIMELLSDRMNVTSSEEGTIVSLEKKLNK